MGEKLSREEIASQFNKLRFDEARHIARGIAEDPNFNITENIREYIEKWNEFLARITKE